MNRLLSVWAACAADGETIVVIEAVRKIEAKMANRLWERIKGTLKD
jgi:hypothetical protein